MKTLTDKLIKKYKPEEIGILISSGIDLGSVAKFLPKNSYAFYANYSERKLDLQKIRNGVSKYLIRDTFSEL